MWLYFCFICVYFFFVSSLFSLVSRAIWFWILFFLRKTIKSRAKCKHTQKKTLSYRIWINGTRVKHDKTNRVNLVKCINANVLCPSKVSSLAPPAWFHSFESCINKRTVKNEWIIRSNYLSIFQSVCIALPSWEVHESDLLYSSTGFKLQCFVSYLLSIIWCYFIN